MKRIVGREDVCVCVCVCVGGIDLADQCPDAVRCCRCVEMKFDDEFYLQWDGSWKIPVDLFFS